MDWFCYLLNGYSSLCVGLEEQGINESNMLLPSCNPCIRKGPTAPVMLVLTSTLCFFYRQRWQSIFGENMLDWKERSSLLLLVLPALLMELFAGNPLASFWRPRVYIFISIPCLGKSVLFSAAWRQPEDAGTGTCGHVSWKSNTASLEGWWKWF